MRALREKPFRRFTLVEMLVSLFLFAGIMALLMDYFSTAQRVWLKSSAKAEMFENARIALDLMENDLLCSYYSYGHSDTKLYFLPKTDTDTSTGRTYYQFGVATMRAAPPNKFCVSNLCEVQYKYDPSTCKMLMNVCGDYCSDGTANGYWDIGSYTDTVKYNANPLTTYVDETYDPSDSTSDPDGWSEVIPCVVDFSFLLYDKQGNAVPVTAKDFVAQGDKMPYSVLFSLTLVDRDSYSRYLAKGGSIKNIASTSDANIVNSKRTFTRRVTIERGQYD